MTGHLPEVELHSERLVLRPYRTADAADVRLACNDPLTRRWISLPDPYDEAVAHTWVTDLSHRPRLDAAGANFAVLSRDSGRLVAGFGLHRIDDRDLQAEIGYWVAPWARGQGVAPEATRRLARWAFDDLGLGRLEVLVQPGNAASHRVAVKAGCSYEGLRTAASAVGPRRVDLAAWRLLPGDPFPAAPGLPIPSGPVASSDGAVCVRPARPDDAPGRHAELADPEYQRWLAPPAGPPAPPPPTVESARQALEEVPWRWLSGQSAAFAVVEAASGSYAGSVVVYLDRPAWAVATIGYATHPAFRGRGLMRRALPLVAQWAFADAGLARLEAGVATGNTASARTAASAGFRREGVLRGFQPAAGGRSDLTLYSLLPGDLR